MEESNSLSQLTKSLAILRLQQAEREKLWYFAAKEHLVESKKEVKDLQDQSERETLAVCIAEKKSENQAARCKIDRLKDEKSILTEQAPPCFRIASHDIDGGKDSGYISVTQGALLVATAAEDDYLYGFEAHNPTNRGWWLASHTEPHPAWRTKDGFSSSAADPNISILLAQLLFMFS